MATNNVLNKPEVFFSASLSSTLSNYSGGGYGPTIICDTVLANFGGGYNHLTGIFTAPVTGTYYLACTATYLARVTGALICSVTLFNSANPNNGSLFPTKNSCAGFEGPNGYIQLYAQTTVPLTVGDSASFAAYGDGGAAVDDIIGDASNIYTSFYGMLL